MDVNGSTNNTEVLARPDIQYWEQIFTGTLIGLIGILGIMGNSMVILAVSFSRKLHSSTNAFVTSLSVADLITSFFLLFYMVGVFGRNSWPIPRAPWLCDLTGIMMIVCRGTSLYMMALIAINRLLLITKPSLYKKIFVSWKLVVCLIIPWTILGGSILIIIIIMRSGSIFGYDKHNLACGFDNANVNAGKVAFTINLIAFPIPLTVTTICYIWIFVYLQNHFQKQKRNRSMSSLHLPSADEMNMTSQTHTSGASALASGPSSLVTCSSSVVSDPPTVSKDHSQIEGAPMVKSPSTLAEGRPQIEEAPMVNNPSALAKKDTHIQGAIVTQLTSTQRKRWSKEQIKITNNLFLVVCSLYLCFLPSILLIFVRNSAHISFYMRVLYLSNVAINFWIYAGKHPDFKLVFGHMMRRSFVDIPKPSRFLKFLLSHMSQNA